MMSPLFIFPMILFAMAVLAFLSGIGIFWTIRRKRSGIFTAFIWSIFSGSISIGFIAFAIFVYITQHNEPLAVGVACAGILAILGSGWLATP
jgi:hypothetical protein